MDESNSTCNKRFAQLGIPQAEEARRAYQELIVTTPGLGESISGAILYDETIRQRKKNGISFVTPLTDAGIIPGIKVGMGAKVVIGDGVPSRGCMEVNAHALARYAGLCQEAGLVPITEPEVLMDGDHTLERCRQVTEEVLRAVFDQLFTQRVLLEGMLLKPTRFFRD